MIHKIFYGDFMFDMDHLRTFAACAETLNFSEAGQRLGRVQSAVSTQIAQLEVLAGHPLFERGRGRPVTLTPAGEKLLVHAERLLRLNAQALRSVRSLEAETVVRFGTTETYAAALLPRVLRGYASQHFDVRVEVVCARSPELLTAFDAGDLDVILVTDQGRQQNRIMEYECDLVWIAGPNFAWEDREPLPVAFMPPGCEFRNAGLTALERSRRNWRLAMSSPSPTGIRAAVEAGLAVTVMPSIAIERKQGAPFQLDDLPRLGRVRVVAHSVDSARDPTITGLLEEFRVTLSEGNSRRTDLGGH